MDQLLSHLFFNYLVVRKVSNKVFTFQEMDYHYQSMNDESLLVKRLSKGDILAFNLLFRKYSVRLFRFALGYLKSRPESEEVVQEVFLKVWEKREDLKEELSFKSFIFTICFNGIKKHFRKQRCISDYLKSGIDKDMDDQTIQTINNNSLQQYINNLVEELPPRRREIFIKSRFEGLSIKEISEELKISHKTVENQLTDALKYLRSKLKRESSPGILFILLFSSLF